LSSSPSTVKKDKSISSYRTLFCLSLSLLLLLLLLLLPWNLPVLSRLVSCLPQPLKLLELQVYTTVPSYLQNFFLWHWSLNPAELLMGKYISHFCPRISSVCKYLTQESVLESAILQDGVQQIRLQTLKKPD
jgi:hypothetical protein